MLGALLLAGAAAAAPLTTRQSTSPCGALSSEASFYYPSDVLKCLETVPFNSTIRDNVMGVATALYTLDIFQYNQLGDSDADLSQGVNVTAEFARINSTSYASDFDFQQDLSNVMWSLNDGHHAWTSCYNNLFTIRHWVPIVSIQDTSSSDPLLYIAPDVETFVQGAGAAQVYSQLGLNASVIAGAQVLGIEGLAAWDYINDVLVPSAGVYQDPAQRLNSLFAAYTAVQGDFGRTPGMFTIAQNYTKDSITLTVKTTDGQTGNATVPWLVQWQGTPALNYETGADLFNANCLAYTASSSNASTTASATSPGATGAETATATATMASASASSTAQPSLSQIAAEAYAACPVRSGAVAYPLQNDPTATSNYLGGRDIQFYTVPDHSDVGVIFVPTFEPAAVDATDSCTNRFIVDAVLGLQNFTSAGVSKVLIDTTNNGGGSVLLNQVLQRLMTGKKYEIDNNFQSLLRKAPLAEAFLQAHINNPSADSGSFGPQLFRNGTNDLSSGTDYFVPGLSQTINGATLLTSNYLEDSIDEIEQLDAAWNLSSNAAFAPSDIVFTGNGLCGSACSSFTNFLIEYYNATAYISTPYPDKSIEFQAFAAGQASTSDELYSEAQSVGLDSPLLPQLEVLGTFGFALRGAVSPNLKPGEFLQYRSFPAQNKYQLTAADYSDPLTNWAYVASQVYK